MSATFPTERAFQNAVCEMAKWMGCLPPLVAEKIAADASGCWLWTASRKANGYGQFNDGSSNHNAHRLVYSLIRGPVAKGLELDHLCNVRHCVNPEHLELVTHAQNVRRAADRITHCPRGHAYEGANLYVHNGSRHCRPCRIARAAERRKAVLA